MKIILTSFRDAKNHEGAPYSIARWKPSHFSWIPQLPVNLLPLYNGIPLKDLEPHVFRRYYEKILEGSVKDMDSYLKQVCEETDSLVLCCWCHPERQKGRDKLFCHRILVGYWIERHWPEIEVIYADGAENPVWERDK